MSRNIILTKGNLQAIADKIRALLLQSLVNKYMPVGYVWATSKAPDNGGNPNLLYPGTTWVRIKGAYLCAAGVSDTVDSDPEHDVPHGSNTRTTANVPKHTHDTITTSTGNKGSDNNYAAAAAQGSSYVKDILYKGDETLTGTGICSESSHVGGTWYGQPYSNNNNTKFFTLNVNIPSHQHVIPTETSMANNTVIFMDIQPKRFYKYVWERTA